MPYFTRTREAQAVAALSQQSASLMDEEALRGALLKLINTKGSVKRPAGWHAYHLALDSIEFWHGSKDRFHKRLRYDLLNGTWRHQRLQP
jgi:pyridoxamine 5'-phosphate oxidase